MEIINPIRNKIPIGQKSCEEPAKLCRQFWSPAILNIPKVLIMLKAIDFKGLSWEKQKPRLLGQ